MPDYEDLAFKPAMTWEELCEYAKKSKIVRERFTSGLFELAYFLEDDGLTFYSTGDVKYKGEIIAQYRTYEQMKNIIDNLYGE